MPQDYDPHDEDEPIQRTGYLVKRGSKIKSWKRRYFKLYHSPRQISTMTYFNSETSQTALSTLNLNLYDYVEEAPEKNNSSRKHCFKLSSPMRTLYMCADSEESMTEWIRDLRAVLKRLRSRRQTRNSERMREQQNTEFSDDSD